VADVELVEKLAFFVGEKRELRAELQAKRLGYLRRVDADGEDAGIGVLETILELLELPELTRAKRSPGASIKKIQRGLPENATRLDELSSGASEREIRESISHGDPEFAAREARADTHVPGKQSQSG